MRRAHAGSAWTRVADALLQGSHHAPTHPPSGFRSFAVHATAAPRSPRAQNRRADRRKPPRPTAAPSLPPPRRLKQPESPVPRPKLRIRDPRIATLLSPRTSSSEFASICVELRDADEIELLDAAEPKAWNIALQKRLVVGDDDGAIELLELLLSFGPENTNAKLWTDLLFTVLRQQSRLANESDTTGILNVIKRKCGDDAVSDIVVSLVNGCANIKMFDEAKFLIQYHATLDASSAIPQRVIGNLMSQMQSKRRYEQVVAMGDELVLGKLSIPLEDVQPQAWMAIFRSAATLQVDLAKYTDKFITWFHAVKDHPAHGHVQFERVLGAVVQTCVANGHERAALRCFDELTREDEEEMETGTLQSQKRRVRPDENIYVNVLKASRELHDRDLFRDVYWRMVRDGVARSAGFGCAIRFCSIHHDANFLKRVLNEAFEVEDISEDGWYLPLEQYNDALGCFAETKSFYSARELFGQLLDSPHLAPSHKTMVEMVENYREAPVDEVFELMDVFLRCNVRPNMHVFTSLLAVCGRHRLIGDAAALFNAMKQEGAPRDVKVYTAVAFVYATHGHLTGVVELLQEMAVEGIADDQVLYDTVVQGIHGSHGVDMCFSLSREVLVAGLQIPEGLYRALIALGTKVGLVERTLHMAYNMECDGFTLTEDELAALVWRCESEAEALEVVRTFSMLHQGRQREEANAAPRFSAALYEDIIELLTSFSQRNAAAQVRQLAVAAGYTIP